MMKKLFTLLLAGAMIMTAGCGAGQKTDSNETGQSDKTKAQDEGDIMFTDEDTLPNLMAVSDGVYYIMTGLYGEDSYRLSVSESIEDLHFVYEQEGAGTWYLYAEGDYAAWAEWGDSGYEYKVYDRKNDKVQTVESVKAGEDEGQNMQMGLHNGKLYYSLNDYKAGKSRILCYDPASEKKETVYETALAENGSCLSVNSGVLTAYMGEGEDARQKLVQIDLESGDKKEIEVPGDLDSLYAVSYDRDNDLIALYYHAVDSETEDIGTFTPGDKEIKSLYSMPENLYAYRDRIDIENGLLYWVTQINTTGDIVDHYSMTQYDCTNDKPQEYKQTFGYALADGKLYTLSYGDGPTVVCVNEVTH